MDDGLKYIYKIMTGAVNPANFLTKNNDDPEFSRKMNLEICRVIINTAQQNVKKGFTCPT